MTNKINTLTVFIKTKEDLLLEEISLNTSSFINSAICRHNDLLKLHKSEKEKLYYIFSKIRPIIKGNSLLNNGVLPKGESYSFDIRAVDFELLRKIQSGFLISEKEKTNSSKFEYITSTIKTHKPKELKTVKISSACQITYGMYGKKLGKKKKQNILSKELNLFKHQLNRNAIIKYNNYMNDHISEDLKIFTNLQLKDSGLLKMGTYATKGVLGFMDINQDENALKVATFCLNGGIGRSCSYQGSGYLDIIVGGVRHD